jgi:hypothetical protein
MPCWITIVQDGVKPKHFPMPAVPRVGDIIDLMPEAVAPGGKYVEVTRVVWAVPFGRDAELLELKEEDLPPVLVYVKSVRTG